MFVVLSPPKVGGSWALPYTTDYLPTYLYNLPRLAISTQTRSLSVHQAAQQRSHIDHAKETERLNEERDLCVKDVVDSQKGGPLRRSAGRGLVPGRF